MPDTDVVYHQRMRRLAVVGAALTLGALGAAPADASRSPNITEKAGIVQAAEAPARCLTIRVSTIDRRYASYTFTPSRMTSKQCRSAASNGITILRRGDRGWKQAWSGSDCSSPGKLGAPKRVWTELTHSYCSS